MAMRNRDSQILRRVRSVSRQALIRLGDERIRGDVEVGSRVSYADKQEGDRAQECDGSRRRRETCCGSCGFERPARHP